MANDYANRDGLMFPFNRGLCDLQNGLKCIKMQSDNLTGIRIGPALVSRNQLCQYCCRITKLYCKLPVSYMEVSN